jgi:hypothetical protein
MKLYRIITAKFGVMLLISLGATMANAAAPTSPVTLTLERVGTSSFASAPAGTDFTTQADEIDAATNGDDADSGGGDDKGSGVNRTLPGTVTGHGKPVKPNARPKSNPSLGTHFQGLNLFNQRFANGGNQFSVEPPDQGLCVGNGFVLESANDVLRVYHTDGTPATGVVDLNTFYGYPAAINRSASPLTFGPSITDPSCLYDQVIGRFVHVVLTLDRVYPIPLRQKSFGYRRQRHRRSDRQLDFVHASRAEQWHRGHAESPLQ